MKFRFWWCQILSNNIVWTSISSDNCFDTLRPLVVNIFFAWWTVTDYCFYSIDSICCCPQEFVAYKSRRLILFDIFRLKICHWNSAEIILRFWCCSWRNSLLSNNVQSANHIDSNLTCLLLLWSFSSQNVVNSCWIVSLQVALVSLACVRAHWISSRERLYWHTLCNLSDQSITNSRRQRTVKTTFETVVKTRSHNSCC